MPRSSAGNEKMFQVLFLDVRKNVPRRLGVRVLILVVAAALVLGATAAAVSEQYVIAEPLVATVSASAPGYVVYPNPYDSPQQFMEGIYAADHAPLPASTSQIRAVIVPHHLTATVTLATGIKMLSGQRFSKILLLSPDHFGHCATELCTVNATYQTQFGPVRATTSTVETLLTSSLVSSNPDLFKTEHGIYAVLPYIAHYFPGVEVTPLALSQRMPWKQDESTILDLLHRVVDDQTMVIVSSDFSHYLPLEQATRMDGLTQQALLSGDLDAIASLNNPSQSDCPSCLWSLGALAKGRGFYNPQILMHTNSATILHQPGLPSTTSHFAIIWKERP
jgi:poly-gamma-glutamate synthesis protein (capsule biosynthesis protein)